jgi:DNA mismatch repair protein MutS
MADPRDTPAMRQFARFKQKHPDCVLLFRIGDFYETFDDDAVTLHKALGLTLTRRSEGIPMAGVPYHQVEVYLRRLIQQGYRVAVCEQIQDAKEAKGIVERAVTRVLTPGTLVDDALLDESASNALAAVAPADLRQPTRLGVAIVELSTGAFTVMECDAASLGDQLAARGVHELLYAEQVGMAETPPAIRRAADVLGISCTPRPAWQFRPSEALEAIYAQYGVATLAGFGLNDEEPAVQAAGAIVRYLKETQTAEDVPQEMAGRSTQARATLAHLQPPLREDASGVCVLDAVSLRSLEVERTIRTGTPGGGRSDGSLVGLMLSGPGACRTPMGKRLTREWLCRPLADLAAIESRHARVALLVEDRRTARALVEALDGVQDVARIAGRVALGRATPRDLVALGRSLARLDAIAATVEHAPAFAANLEHLRQVRETLAPVAALITEQCVENPPAHLREGGLFKEGMDAELDEAKLLQRDASTWLASYQQRLSEEHNLPGIKVGYNRVFGYYIELTALQARGAPDAFTRKQTLKNAERYTTPELKEFEEKVTTAEARAIERERALFDRLCARAAACIPAIAGFAQVVAELDVLGCFAERAVRRGWVRPQMVSAPALRVVAGRHPVLEEMLGDNFVPNDVDLGGTSSSGGIEAPEGDGMDIGPGSPEHSCLPASAASCLALITGPNMAGKSTFIRQTALIVLLAHAGSFVPAQEATIGLTDRIFTRVGADDALHAGQSTFMVEMTETASILNNASGRSLVILDEIGRGTSTLDGLSLAWAIAEFLAGAEGSNAGPRTLFATHYHELTELEERLPGRVRNLHVSVREWGDQIIFLHRILPGRSDRSYGVHVARLAGIPSSVIARARDVLASLSVHHHGPDSPVPKGPGGATPPGPPNGQLSLFTEYVNHPALEQLRELKLEALSPIQAFDTLRRLKERLETP